MKLFNHFALCFRRFEGPHRCLKLCYEFRSFECIHLPYIQLKRRFLREGKVFFSTSSAGTLPKGLTSLWYVNMYEWNRLCRAMKGNGFQNA